MSRRIASGMLFLTFALILLTGCTFRSTSFPTPSPTSTATPTAAPTSTPAATATPTPDPEALPAGWNDGGIFSGSYEEAWRLLRTMTLEEKAGQVLLARCPRTGAVDAVRAFHLGGFTLFSADFKDRTKAQVVADLRSYREVARIPLAFAVDEEGGQVVRISSNPLLVEDAFHSPHYLYRHGGMKAVEADAAEKASLLRSLGIHLNLAPVADVSTDSDDYIHGRTLGQSAALTSDFVALVVRISQEAGLSSTLKHFPGYGSNKDTHGEPVVDSRPMATFETSDLLPFQAGIEAGVEAVMVSHVIVACMDPDRPASLSPAVHAFLRDRLHFTGIVLTDSLGMGAIAAYTDGKDPHVEALLAGSDLLCTPLYAQGYEAILAAVHNGVVPAETLDRAVFRVLAWKLARGILGEVQ